MKRKKENNNIAGYSVQGKPIIYQQLDKELEAAQEDIKNGNVISHSQLKEEIKNWRVAKKK